MNQTTTINSRDEAQAWLRSLERAWLEDEPCDLVCRYAADCEFRQGGEKGQGRAAVRRFAEHLRRRDEFRHHFELWAHDADRIVAVVNAEWWDERTGYWFRGHGNARFELASDGTVKLHDIAIDSVPIPQQSRQLA